MIDITKFEGHTAGPWSVGPWFDNDEESELVIEHKMRHGTLVTAVAIGGLIGQEANARLIAAAPDLLAEVIRLRDMLQKARDGLSCGLWDYGPGQSEHDQCDELLAEIDEILKGAK